MIAQRTSYVTCICCFLILTLILRTGTTQEPPREKEATSVTVAQITQVWKERQERVSLLDFSWEGTKFERIKPDSPAFGSSRHRPALLKTLPPDITFAVKARSVFDSRDRYRYEEAGKEWSVEHNQLKSRLLVWVHNAGLETRFFTSEIATPLFASVQKRPFEMLLQSHPLRLTYRPFGAMGVFDAARLEVTGVQGVVEGRPCLILTHRSKDGNDERIWVDVERGYLPIRYHLLSHGKVPYSVDISHRADQRLGWVPSGWKYVNLTKSGSVDLSEAVTVTKYSINETTPEDPFRVGFPEGTLVNDYVSEETYVVRPGGERRVHQEGESYNYAYLLNTEPGGTPRRRWGWITAAIVTAVGVGGVAAVWLYRRRAARIKAA